ncbi:hypothetical protein LRS12_15700 [Sphingomonas sp. J344]|uniref:hypothetical protein n=1 Tax=Sphingomonas sp. J344 TaxID=2898434 RepID=UPI0021516B57|nr:hypothetical protein [Sphingomonas sp. J344]MCR5872027.1 hypothetical protein [Sphingomonas sp. J344]
MKALFMSAALAAVLAAPSALAAKKEKVVFVEASAVADKPVVTLDTTKAYVMLRSDIAVPLHLMRVPDAEDQAKVRPAARRFLDRGKGEICPQGTQLRARHGFLGEIPQRVGTPAQTGKAGGAD